MACYVLCIVGLKYVYCRLENNSFGLQVNTCNSPVFEVFSPKQKGIIIHLAGQTYVWHGCKWNFAGPQIYLQPAKIKSSFCGFVELFGL